MSELTPAEKYYISHKKSMKEYQERNKDKIKENSRRYFEKIKLDPERYKIYLDKKKEYYLKKKAEKVKQNQIDLQTATSIIENDIKIK